MRLCLIIFLFTPWLHINGTDSVYIDNDILEIIQDYKGKSTSEAY